ncbi:MAG: hypothetical protein JWR88_693 [Pseudonocardia sp.]|nr:hypothetical protein [Pseudonocardia sp.]
MAYRLAMQVPPLDGPPVGESDPRELLLGYLDWYRDALMRKLDGLSDAQLRTPVGPLGWSPLGLVKHLGWVERRWLRWGFAAEPVAPEPPGGRDAEFVVAGDEDAASVLTAYRDEVGRATALIAGAELGDQARVGGRFPRRIRRHHWRASCSTCCRSTRATSGSSTSLERSSTSSRGSSDPHRFCRCGHLPWMRSAVCALASPKWT